MELKDALLKLHKTLGKESIFEVKNHEPVEIERTSYGIPTMNSISGGGCPNGRIIEFYGGESSAKTTAAIHAAIEHQKRGRVGYIDYEHAFDMGYAASLGLDVEELIFSQPFSAEEGLEIVDTLSQCKDISLIIVDSVAAMSPKKELEGDAGDSVMGLHARLMSQALRKLVGKASSNGVTIIFINQTRSRLGIVYGDPTTTTGGNALKFYASQRFAFSASKVSDDGKSRDIIVKNIKNKVATPLKKGTFSVEFGKGVDILADTVTIAVEKEIISKAGSWYNYGDTKLGQGVSGVKALLADNPELLEEIKSQI